MSAARSATTGVQPAIRFDEPIEWRAIPGYDEYEVSSRGDIRVIRKMYAAGARNRWIAEFYDVSPSTICDIIKGRRWKHVGE